MRRPLSSSKVGASRPTKTARRGDTLQRWRDGTGLLGAAAMRRLDDDLAWYRNLPAEHRSWVGLVAQAGIDSFVTWYAEPTAAPHGVSEIFAGAGAA